MNFKQKNLKNSFFSQFDVIICTLNRHSFFKKNISMILKSSLLPHRIIIIDQNFNDTSKKFAQKYFNDYNFKNYLFVKNLHNIGLTHSKNIGLDYVQSKYIFFLDDDILVDKHYFRNMMEILKKTKCHGVSGIVKNYKIRHFNNFFYNLFNFYEFKDNRRFFVKKNLKTKSQEVYHLPGGISAYQSSIFKKIKFDNKLVIHNYEDVDFNYRLKKKIKNLKLRISFRSNVVDQLANMDRHYGKRLYFMRLIYLKHSNLKLFFVYHLSLLGLILFNLVKFNFKFFFDLYGQIKSANKKYYLFFSN